MLDRHRLSSVEGFDGRRRIHFPSPSTGCSLAALHSDMRVAAMSSLAMPVANEPQAAPPSRVVGTRAAAGRHGRSRAVCARWIVRAVKRPEPLRWRGTTARSPSSTRCGCAANAPAPNVGAASRWSARSIISACRWSWRRRRGRGDRRGRVAGGVAARRPCQPVRPQLAVVEEPAAFGTDGTGALAGGTRQGAAGLRARRDHDRRPGAARVAGRAARRRPALLRGVPRPARWTASRGASRCRATPTSASYST